MNYPQIQLYVGAQQVHGGELTCPLELGREDPAKDRSLYVPFPKPHGEIGYRLVIADKTFKEMSRRIMLLTPIDDRHVRVKNLSDKYHNHILVSGQEPLWPGEERDCEVPTVLSVFDRRVEVTKAKQFETVFISMNEPIRPPGSGRDTFPEDISSNFPLADKLNQDERDQITQWLGAVTRVLQSAISSADFSERASKEMVDLIGLDAGRVLELKDDGSWVVVASYDRAFGRRLSDAWVPVNDLLQQVIVEKRTCWTSPSDQSDPTPPEGRRVAIAAPLLNPAGEVIGALYGDRPPNPDKVDDVLGKLEAMIVETLARGVAAGRARVDQERVVAEVQVRFEQFFTPELSRQLAANPDLLTRRDTEVTVLFCDIRQFSTVSESCGAELTMEWLSDVMSNMADCAAVYDGALIDYIGDELMLMWGAPGSQPDHATRACQAALKMARNTAALDEKWRKRLGGHATQLGFGINTGSARVGNVGFERKFRYAPFGNTVNLASRVQGATKYLGARVVVTDDTFQQLRSRPISRRLCSVRVVNIERPVVLHELRPDDSLEAKQLCEQYELALSLYEQGQLPQSIHQLSQIIHTLPEDGPTLLLLSRAVESLRHPDVPFDPVFELPGK